MTPTDERRLVPGHARSAAWWAWWLVPVVFLVWLYHDGLFTWFMADDFAWLSLLRLVRTRHDLLHEMFAPMAQGTIRPWSERGYFMLLSALSGLDSLPFRIVAFATAAADVILIAWLTLRTTGSRIAGFVAPFLWIANTALVRAMTWSSAYNEVMCPLFLMAALALFIRYSETGRSKYWWWQLVIFSLGFGVLEINVVYPALAAAWIIFTGLPNRSTALRSLIPLAGVSAVYAFVHRWVAPLPTTGAYALQFNGQIFKTSALYWKWSLAPEPMVRYGYTRPVVGFVVVIGTVAIIAFVAAELRRRRYRVLFYLTWFAVTLAPMIPLPNHRSDYYLTIPVIGIAMLGGSAAGRYWNQPFARRAMMGIPIGLYLWAMIPVTLSVSHWWRQKAFSVRGLVLGVVAARETHPGKAIVLERITPELFELSFHHSPFVALGIDDVYLTTEAALNLASRPEITKPNTLVVEPSALWHGITHDEVVVYSFGSDRLRNVTEGYARRLAGQSVDRLPPRVDIGNFLYSWLLGPEWLPPESGIRWMPGSATLRIGVPVWGRQLEITGSCPEAQLLASSRHLMVLVDGVLAGETRIYDPESTFRRLIPLPAGTAGKTSVEIEIRVDPVNRKDDQDYGLVFGQIAIRP